jgi:hypothetical protein
MTDESNIISLSDRARERKERKPVAGKHGRRGSQGAGGQGPESGASGEQSESETGSAPESAAKGPVPAKLVWLFCPSCETLEYTEMLMPGGRVHQPCGTRVEEVEVDLDARAEYSLAELNLRQLERLAELVEGQRARFREYQHRLELAASKPLSSYPLTEDTVSVMPVAEVDPMGLLISAFLRQPLQRFRPEPSVVPSTPPSNPLKTRPDAADSDSDSWGTSDPPDPPAPGGGRPR